MSQKKKTLYFKAKKSREKLKKTITFTNSTPETILDGHWEVVYDDNDYSSTKSPYSPTNHPWISFSRQTIKGKKVEEGEEDSVKCEIIIDTKNLAPRTKFSRTIKLQLNTEQEWYEFPIVVETAPPDNIRIPYKSLSLLALTLTIIAFIATTNVNLIVKGVENVSIQTIAEKTKTRIPEIDIQIKNLEENLNKIQEEQRQKQFPWFFTNILVPLFAIWILFGIASIKINSIEGLVLGLIGLVGILVLPNVLISHRSSEIQRMTSEISGLKSLKQDYSQMLANNNILTSLAIQEYWSNNTLNINLIIGVAISLAGGLLYFAYSYLSGKGKYKIKNPLLEIFVLLLITSIAIATGIGFHIGFNYWYILLPIILPMTILITMQIRYIAYISGKQKQNPKLISK